MVEFMQQQTTITSGVYCVECWHPVYSQCFSMTMFFRIQLLALERCSNIATRSCLATLLTALISFWATTCLLVATSRTGSDHSVSTKVGTDSSCQNVAELKGGRLLWYKHTKLIPRYYKWLSSGCDYVEKQLKYVRNCLHIIIFCLIACFVKSS
jgi:hypothetical protein